jgi:hypothetical protein
MAGFFAGIPRVSELAALNVLYDSFRFSSISRIDATFPHL